MTSNRLRQWLHQRGIWLASTVAAVAVLAGSSGFATAAANDADFNIQVSPSPLVLTLQPGVAKAATISVRNFSNHAETLYPRLNAFTTDKQSRNIKLIETAPVNMQDWVRFSDATLQVPAGATKQLTIQFDTPANVGFTYSAAVILSRSQDGRIESDGVRLRGAVAVFCLVNIDRPDAKRELTADTLDSDKDQYQYLPATFTLTIRNTGNIIDQPAGSIFIQRSFDDETPIAVLPINPGSNYILPGTSRDFTVSWDAGFPKYVTDAHGKRHLSWDWKHLNELRFGRYVAKAVIVYNDGKRDVPVITAKTFWVIPWTLLLITLAVIVILVMGIVAWGRILVRGTRKVRSYAARRK